MVRLKAIVVANIAAMLDRWETLSVASGLNGTAVTLEDFVEGRIYLYDIPKDGVSGFPCLIFRDGKEENEPISGNTLVTENATHRIDAHLFCVDSDMLTLYRKSQRTARAVADVIDRYGTTTGDPTANSGYPWHARVESIEFGDIANTGSSLIREAVLGIVAKERAARVYTSI